MKNEKGQPTNALYGVLKMIQQLCRKKAPDYIVSCFDSKTPSFRKQIYPAYKAHRGEMPEDLEVQVPYLKKMMNCLSIPFWEKPGFEADDLIASLTHISKGKGWQIYIVSGDKDFAQLVDSHVFLYDTMKEIIYDPSGVEEKWGLSPLQMQDYLSLTGDSSDNIPGVKGIGPKGACQLLKSYNNLEGIYKHIDYLQPALRKKLVKDRENAFLSRQLISLKADIVWDRDIEDTRRVPISELSLSCKQALKSFLEELGFKSFMRDFFPVKTESPKPLEGSYKEPKRLVLVSQNNSSKQEPKTFKMKQQAVEDFKNKLPPYSSVGIGEYQNQLYLSYGKYFVLLTAGELKSWADFLDYKWVRYSGHDLKFLWKKLKIEHPVAEWDSMIAGHLINSAVTPSLKSLFQIHLNIPEEEDPNLPQTLFYQQKLREKLFLSLQKEEMLTLFEDIELPLIAVLYDMERQGLLLDFKEIEKQSTSLGRDIEELEFQIHKLAGEKFNLLSHKQLNEVLFTKLNLPRGRKIKTGYSTDGHELLKIRNLHPILPLILEHRELFKLKSTYTNNLLSLRDEKTGRIYTNFRQAGTVTGRLSSLKPNLQNIPLRTQRGQLIRKAFLAQEGNSLICADYSQVELRILAHITKDESLCKAFEEDLDIHAITASEIFNVPLKDLSSDLRRKSKAVNFGIAYGQGAYGLSESLSIPRSEAKEIIENYFKKFKKIKDYIETTKEELPKKNYVQSLYGRKRFFRPADLQNPRRRAAVERAGINAPLQGTASDLIKKAMIALNESLPIPILSQIHDELLFECPTEQVMAESQEIVPIMEKNEVLTVPLKVNLSIGKNWFMAQHN